jgi:hypothetical protein
MMKLDAEEPDYAGCHDHQTVADAELTEERRIDSGETCDGTTANMSKSGPAVAAYDGGAEWHHADDSN